MSQILNTQIENKSLLAEPLVKFFKGKNFAFLGTINKDGSPHVTPTWIDIEENGEDHREMILINTAMDRIKQKNVSRDPRVSISIADENNPYSMISVKGRVVEQTTKRADEHVDKLAQKYLNVERYPAHSPNVKRVILKIKPEKLFYIPPRYTEYLQKTK